jgi:hypothetical protein
MVFEKPRLNQVSRANDNEGGQAAHVSQGDDGSDEREEQDNDDELLDSHFSACRLTKCA